MKKRVSAPGIICFILSLLMTVLVLTVSHACVHDDGTYSSCHWAGVVSMMLGVVMAVLSAASVLRTGLPALTCTALAAMVSVLAFLTPGTLVPLCMMAAMRCNAIMRPTVMVLSGIVAVISLLRGIFLFRKQMKGNV